MKVHFLPRTKAGVWSLGLIITMPMLFMIGSSFAGSLYRSVPAGGTIPTDIVYRPALALTMLLGMVCGVSSFGSGFYAIAKSKDRGLLVLASTLLGMLFTLFMIGEILFPH